MWNTSHWHNGSIYRNENIRVYTYMNIAQNYYTWIKMELVDVSVNLFWIGTEVLCYGWRVLLMISFTREIKNALFVMKQYKEAQSSNSNQTKPNQSSISQEPWSLIIINKLYHHHQKNSECLSTAYDTIALCKIDGNWQKHVLSRDKQWNFGRKPTQILC